MAFGFLVFARQAGSYGRVRSAGKGEPRHGRGRDERGTVARVSCEGNAAMAGETQVGPTSEFGPGPVVGVGGWAVGNAAGTYFAVSRRCRHLGTDLAKGSIDDEGCLVCPWHESRYDVETGRMVRGPQGIFA